MKQDLAMFDGEFIREMFANYLLEAYPEETIDEDSLLDLMHLEKYQQEFLELIRRELWESLVWLQMNIRNTS